MCSPLLYQLCEISCPTEFSIQVTIFTLEPRYLKRSISCGIITKLRHSITDFVTSETYSRIPKVDILRQMSAVNLKRPVHSQLNRAIVLCEVMPYGKNWVNCAVLTVNSAGLRTVVSSRLSGNPTVSSVYLPTPRWHHLKAHAFLAIHSADRHRMIYSFSNTTSYSTFYAFFSSFRITLWPMWLANNKRQPCFCPPQSHAQGDTQNWQKNWKTWWETCAVPENIQFSFSCSFLHS
jgi:hypothetical protein